MDADNAKEDIISYLFLCFIWKLFKYVLPFGFVLCLANMLLP